MYTFLFHAGGQQHTPPWNIPPWHVELKAIKAQWTREKPFTPPSLPATTSKGRLYHTRATARAFHLRDFSLRHERHLLIRHLLPLSSSELLSSLSWPRPLFLPLTLDASDASSSWLPLGLISLWGSHTPVIKFVFCSCWFTFCVTGVGALSQETRRIEGKLFSSPTVLCLFLYSLPSRHVLSLVNFKKNSFKFFLKFKF